MAVKARDEVTLTRIEVDEETRWHFWHDEEGAHVTEAERPGEGEPATGKNVLVTGESILVRDGETVIASFGDDLIELGKGSESARIELCGGSTVISREGDFVDIRSEVSTTGGGNNTILRVGTSGSSISFYNRGLESMPAIFTNGAIVLGRNTIVAEDRNARTVTAEQIFDALDNAAYVKTLWSNASGWYMTGSQRATLSEPVSSQARGIVLHWQRYVSGAAQDYNHQYFFVPRSHVADHGGTGVNFLMTDGNAMCSKYVYVADTVLTGNDQNSKTVSASCGVTLTNGGWVLTEVLGV